MSSYLTTFLMVLRMKLNDFGDLLTDPPADDYDCGKCFKIIRYDI